MPAMVSSPKAAQAGLSMANARARQALAVLSNLILSLAVRVTLWRIKWARGTQKRMSCPCWPHSGSGAAPHLQLQPAQAG